MSKRAVFRLCRLVHVLGCAMKDIPRITQCLFVLDDDYETDRRVRAAAKELGCYPQVLDLRHSVVSGPAGGLRAFIRWHSLFAAGAWRGLRSLRIVRPYLRDCAWRDFFNGLPAAFRWLWRAALMQEAVRERMREGGVTTIYAADLYCAVAALPGRARVRFVYDSHEVQFHRQRRKGALRILLEFGLESMVVQSAGEIRTVNWRIAGMMKRWYAPKVPLIVRYNDFYAHQDLPLPPCDAPPAIVYVGKGVQGRRLELLDMAHPPCEIHVFLLGSERPKHISGQGWNHGQRNYLPELVRLRQRRRCLMWAASETDCLSYRLALPNKFFQAMALGIPIIASKETYLGQLVEKYEIGLIHDGLTLEEIVQKAAGEDYFSWVQNVEKLRSGVVAGTWRI